jgi:hypothetical protein
MNWTFPKLIEVDKIFPYDFAHVPCVVFMCYPLAYRTYHPWLANYIENNLFMGKTNLVVPIQKFPTTISKQVESTHGIFIKKLVHNHNGNHPYKNWQPLLGRHNQVWM